jgi:hypothetical protein
MANTTIRIKHSGAAGNVPADLDFGELAVNYHDGALYYKNHYGIIASLGGAGGGNGFGVMNVNSTLVFATSPADILSLTSANGITFTTNNISKSVRIDDSKTVQLAQAAFDAANSGANFTIVSTNSSLMLNQKNVLIDTSSGPVNISLPIGINTGYAMIIGDGGGDKEIAPAYIYANTSTINGASGSLKFNAPNMLFYMIYTGSTWKVLLNA